MRVSATSKFVHTSARKTGLVAALIRGRAASEAAVILAYTNKRATDPVGKALASAVANAINNHNLKSDALIVSSVLIGPGPTFKRFRPVSRGRAHTIRKRTSHITVTVTDEKETK